MKTKSTGAVATTPFHVQSGGSRCRFSLLQGHYFIRDGEYIYETSASADKKFTVLEGANHGLGPCAPCSMLHGGADYSTARINLLTTFEIG